MNYTNKNKYNISIYQDNLIQIIIKYASHLLKDVNHKVFVGYNNKSHHFNPEIYINYGEYEIPFNNTSIKLNYSYYDKPLATSSTIDIFKHLIISNNENYHILESFIKQAREYQLESKNTKKVICYMMTHGTWRILSHQDKREMKTIYLEQKVKDNLIRDIHYFLTHPEIYLNLGIPYKRNYLLEGIPGTGKTSLILAVASYFNMNIGILSLNKDLDDFSFMKSISNIPDDTILVLEDIDALFDDDRETCLSFSGLLNILDGLARQIKLIIFMTTNHINKLNKSLKRAGRVDYKIHFDFCNQIQIKEIINSFFPDLELNTINEFIKQIKTFKLTPAMLQTYFQRILFMNNLENENTIESKIINEINILNQISQEFMEDYQTSLYL
mgnify:FL=1